jgi:hypothetical protein
VTDQHWTLLAGTFWAFLWVLFFILILLLVSRL